MMISFRGILLIFCILFSVIYVDIILFPMISAFDVSFYSHKFHTKHIILYICILFIYLILHIKNIKFTYETRNIKILCILYKFTNSSIFILLFLYFNHKRKLRNPKNHKTLVRFTTISIISRLIINFFITGPMNKYHKKTE